MCTELLLAIIYFATIFVVNYFLYKLLTNYIRNIFSLLKIKNIFNAFPLTKTSIFSLLSLYTKNSTKKRSLLLQLHKSFNNQDLLVLGNVYRFLLNEKQKPEEIKTSSMFYFQLLENQYISRQFELK